MAIARTPRPSLVVVGYVESTRVLNKSKENGGAQYGIEVTVKQSHADGAMATYTIYDGSGAFPPSVGSFVAVECSLQESRQYGASLAYERVADNVLDLVASTLSAA